jgi:hypothetical protein
MLKPGQNTFNRYHIQKAMDFGESLQEMERFVRENMAVSSKQTTDYLHLMKLNFQRMKRVYKTTIINDKLMELASNLRQSLIWMVITDPRCGDSAQSIPVMQRIAELTSKIELKIILRDDHPEIMDAFLTGDARAIPKLICLDSETLKVVGTWGPRPKPLQEILMKHKENPVMSKSEFSEKIQRKYLEDKTRTIQKEFLELLKSCNLQIY